MKVGQMYWEKFKSFLLFCLVISSFGLTGIYMFERASGLEDYDLKTLSVPPANVALSEIIHPQGLYVNFGGDSHAAFFFESGRLTEEILDEVSGELEGREALPVDRSVWETVGEERSIRIKFGYDAMMSETVGVGLPEGATLDEMLIPLLGRDFVLIRSGDDFYKITAFLMSSLEQLVAQLEAEDYTEFKTIETRFSIQEILEENGIVSELNQTIIPIEMRIAFPFYKSEKAIDMLDNEAVALYVRKIFGDDPSFIKSMVTYDETQIYVSNYGKRSLSFEANGNVEYVNNRTPEEEEVTLPTVKEVVQQAWAFVEYLEGDTGGVFLMDVLQSGQRTTLWFGTEIEDQWLYHLGTDRGEAIKVEIQGGEVIYYRSNRRVDFEPIDVSHLWTQGMSFSKIFDKNFDTFKDYYEDDVDRQSTGDTRTYVFEILNAISAYDFEYFVDIDKRSNSIIPAWRIQIADTVYHIDIYDGVLLGVEKEVPRGLEED